MAKKQTMALVVKRKILYKKAMGGGLNAAIEKVKKETMTAKEGKVVRMTKRKSKNKNIARGCGAIMSGRRKVTKYS